MRFCLLGGPVRHCLRPELIAMHYLVQYNILHWQVQEECHMQARKGPNETP